jgi:hypothetical protein
MFTLSSVLASLKKLRQEGFECLVCLEPCTDTLINPECNHRFCGKCIKDSLRKCNHECPTCRVHIPTYRTCRRDPQFVHFPLEKKSVTSKNKRNRYAVVPEKETQEIVGQKRSACTCTGTSSTSAATEMIAADGTRISKRVKVAPTHYVPAEGEVSYASSGVVTRNTALTASPPLEYSSATDETMDERQQRRCEYNFFLKGVGCSSRFKGQQNKK